MQWHQTLAVWGLMIGLHAVSPMSFDHSLFRALLTEHVEDGRVDYLAIKEDSRLEEYLEMLGSAHLEELAQEEQIAFLINAYNAMAIQGVLSHWPVGNVKQDLDDFFTERVYAVAGELHSLDEIEDKLLAFNDARFHFTLTCASSSCPKLETEPYGADGLEARLEQETREFLSDPVRGVSYESESNVLWLPRYFLWFGGDFVEPELSTSFFQRIRAYLSPRSTVLPFVLRYLPEDLVSEIHERQPEIAFKDYDWSLNGKAPPSI